MAWPFEPLQPLAFDVIVVDPPWDFELYSEAGAEKSASAQYETMPLDAIAALPVGHLAGGDCLVLLWTCEWVPPRARQLVLDEWGFTYKTSIVWRKTTRRGKVRVGPGYRARTMHEPVIVAVNGNPQHSAFPSIFDGIAREHSRKPDEFYELVRRKTPHAKRADLFSRQSRDGFQTWGRESTKFDEVAA